MQLALAELIEDGLVARHIRRMQRVYRARRDRLIAALERELGDRIDILPASAGLHVTALFERADTAVIARAARKLDVAVASLDGYYQRRARSGLSLGYGLIPETKIDEGIRRLASACKERF
jgi:GntR family transcriptional regulator/MocR family aminotransferase